VTATIVAPPEAPDAHRTRRGGSRRNALPVGAVVMLSTLGVLCVAIGYAAGRTGAAYGMVWYWIGQALVFLPIMIRVLSGPLTQTRAFALVAALTINGYALKWTYSPDQLRFSDELQHWTATGTVMRTGSLFQPNDALPAAVHFPGLAEMGAAVSTMTGLSLTASAFIVAGILHLMCVAAIFVLIRACGGSPRLAALTCVVYATGLHFLFFDSMYVYQTAALPFLVLTFWALRRWGTPHGPIAWSGFAVAGLVSILMVTISHHVTSLVMLAALVGFAAIERSRRSVIAAAVAFAVVAIWIGAVAPEVISYLAQPFTGMFGSKAGNGSAGGSPVWILLVQAVGIIGLVIVFLAALRREVRRRRRVAEAADDATGTDAPRPAGVTGVDAWWLAALGGGLLFFLGGGLRLIGSSGPELAARAATFTYIPLAVVVAAVILSGPRRRLVAGGVLLAVLAVGARLGGWPPSWELLPGRYLAAGAERSIDPQGIAAASWTERYLGPGNRIAADLSGWTLTSSYGRQNPVGDVAQLYDSPRWTDADAELADRLGITYLWVDKRLATSTPPTATLFYGDPRTGERTSPMPLANLTKFDDAPGISKVYDDGAIVIYRLGAPE